MFLVVFTFVFARARCWRKWVYATLIGFRMRFILIRLCLNLYHLNFNLCLFHKNTLRFYLFISITYTHPYIKHSLFIKYSNIFCPRFTNIECHTRAVSIGVSILTTFYGCWCCCHCDCCCYYLPLMIFIRRLSVVVCQLIFVKCIPNPWIVLSWWCPNLTLKIKQMIAFLGWLLACDIFK